MKNNEINKVLNPYTSNENGSIIYLNTSSSGNLAIYTNTKSSLLYSHNLNHNSIVSTAASRTLTKWTTVFHTRKDSHISSAHIVIEKSANSYANQTMISNVALCSGSHTLNDTMSNAVTVNTNSEVAMFTISGHRSAITL